MPDKRGPAPQFEALFADHASSVLRRVNLKTGASHEIGEPGLFSAVSRVGKHLLTERLLAPFRYRVAWQDFARSVELRDAQGRVQRELGRIKLKQGVPVDGVVTGPREFWASPGADAAIWLLCQGASSQGDRPFLDRFTLADGQATRLFQSGTEAYERPVTVLEAAGARILTSRESFAEPPNLQLRSGAQLAERRALTQTADPTPQLREIRRERVRFKRADGVELSFWLYLPRGYQITANAEAIIDKAVEPGVSERGKMVVGGHSYGAFMTAKLLAHTRLFRAGIARSGAYNRSLTPFGF
ncbi:prolyl oligopeptidase family serine peptidase [Paucibacter sp. APW11]|uniref:Prolyl oligopeptidase family serine peptidase n=1 Tax=Roseateles aquae TaxID=3077235 RepID=A0ABU3PHA8_9BURK|nr:prolyl oligopeptidase family serine peptidase [Paucibacter sp. APW11]MDT9001930.1 prolyl oligopeptidase family serine peptidase [Paucibacter sp. APW11]